jgi:hypothetical protein
VAYARPFKSNTYNGLGSEWAPQDEGALALHCALIYRRDKTFAHTDRDSGRDAIDVGSMLGLETSYGEEWAPFDEMKLPRIIALCESQRARFRMEIDRLEAILNSHRVDPGK